MGEHSFHLSYWKPTAFLCTERVLKKTPNNFSAIRYLLLTEMTVNVKDESGHVQIYPFLSVFGEVALLRQHIFLAHPWNIFYRKDWLPETGKELMLLYHH